MYEKNRIQPTAKVLASSHFTMCLKSGPNRFANTARCSVWIMERNLTEVKGQKILKFTLVSDVEADYKGKDLVAVDL